MPAAEIAQAFQQFALSGVDAGMVLRAILEPAPEQHAPHQAEAPEHSERPSPARRFRDSQALDEVEYEQDQQRSEGSAGARCRPHDSSNLDPFVTAEPGGKGLGQ